MNKDLIQQLESSYQFLQHLYATTKDTKQLDQIKKEMFECGEQLNRIKQGYVYE